MAEKAHRPSTAEKLKITEESGFYEPYSHFSRTLRAWMVGYGIGAPVLILSQDRLSDTIIDSGKGTLITVLFLGGVGVQIVAALLYKYSMWILYACELEPSVQGKRYSKVADWISDAFGLELTFDIVSLALFLSATFIVMNVVIG